MNQSVLRPELKITYSNKQYSKVLSILHKPQHVIETHSFWLVGKEMKSYAWNCVG